MAPRSVLRPRPAAASLLFALAVVALPSCADATGPGEVELRVTPAGPLVLRKVGATTRLSVEVRDGSGRAREAEVRWSSSTPAVATVDGTGLVTAVAHGAARITARGPGASVASVDVVVTGNDGTPGSLTEVGFAPYPPGTLSDLWLHGDHAYTGTLVRPACSAPGGPCRGLVGVWSVADPAAPVLLDTLPLDAVTVNDVKVSADGTLLVATHEGSADRRNGITLFDLADPAAPVAVTRYTEGLEWGVHNVWIERIGGRDYVFAVADGSTPAAGLRIVDVTDREAPVEVARFYAASSLVHDVYVRDGLAFVSHWDAGLVILDVGHGIRGGAPWNPVEVSRIVTRGGNIHNAWYWPDAATVFVGQEQARRPGEPVDSLGHVFVVDVSDLEEPRVVATAMSPGATPHNFWVDEEAAVLFVGWYGAGLRALDVSGELRGELEDQGRIVAVAEPDGPLERGSIWAPQLHRGFVWVSDIRNGLRSYLFDAGGG